MSTLWRWVKALNQYHTAHQRQYPDGFSLPGLAKTAPLIRKLTAMTAPPLHPLEFMTDFDVKYRANVTLARGLETVLPQLTEYLDTDDSRNILKEPTHDT